MVYVDAEELKWMPFVKTWLQTRCDRLREDTQAYLFQLFEKYVEAGLRYVSKKCTVAMPQVTNVNRLCPC